MHNNQMLRNLSKLLDADAQQLAALAQLAGSEVGADEVAEMLLHKDHARQRYCEDDFLVHVLDGLIVHFRGRDDSRPPRPAETPVSNNLVLKKLRIAFNLKEEDLYAIFEAADVEIGKYELKAWFRKPGNKHYRECSDELLQAFIEGLAMTGWPDDGEEPDNDGQNG